MPSDNSSLLLLDFDGVINALSGSVCGDKNVWREWETATLDGISILYSPVIVRAINAISEQVEVKWLTTWCEESALFKGLGFKEFPFIDAPRTVTTAHWKLDSALTVIGDFDTVVWCDDDPFVERAGVDFATEFVRPMSETGLCKKHVRRICHTFDLDYLGLIS